MELLKNEIKRPKISIRNDSKLAIGIAAISAMEGKLENLKSIFSAANFILAEQDVRALSHLLSKYAQVKINMSNYLQKPKMSPMGIRKLAPGRQAYSGAMLEAEILSLKLQLEKLNNRIFRKPLRSRHIL